MTIRKVKKPMRMISSAFVVYIKPHASEGWWALLDDGFAVVSIAL